MHVNVLRRHRAAHSWQRTWRADTAKQASSLLLQDCLLLDGTNVSANRFLWHVVVHQRDGSRRYLAPDGAFCKTLVNECINQLRKTVTEAEYGVILTH